MVNDKIYELAKQADLIEFDSIPGSKAVTPNYESIVKARKFAELIIRECIDIADTYQNRGGNCYVNRMIAEHFGVKE